MGREGLVVVHGRRGGESFCFFGGVVGEILPE